MLEARDLALPPEIENLECISEISVIPTLDIFTFSSIFQPNISLMLCRHPWVGLAEGEALLSPRSARCSHPESHHLPIPCPLLLLPLSNNSVSFLGYSVQCLCVCSTAKSCPTLVTPWTIAWQAPLSMGFPQARILEWVAISISRGILLT